MMLLAIVPPYLFSQQRNTGFVLRVNLAFAGVSNEMQDLIRNRTAACGSVPHRPCFVYQRGDVDLALLCYLHQLLQGVRQTLIDVCRSEQCLIARKCELMAPQCELMAP